MTRELRSARFLDALGAVRRLDRPVTQREAARWARELIHREVQEVVRRAKERRREAGHASARAPRLTTKVYAALFTGAKWFAWPQRPGTSVSHHGIMTKVAGYRVSACPVGAGGRPVLVVEVARDHLYKAFTAEQVQRIRSEIDARGLRVFDQWNGAGCSTVSFSLVGLSHATLRAASENRSGAPVKMPDGWS